MLVRKFGVVDETAKPKSRNRKPIAPLIAALAVLAGCQNVADFSLGLSETTKPGSAAEAEKPATDKQSAETVKLDRPTVRRVQAQLAENGFESGPHDGIMGPKTAAAIKRYQSTHGLPVTGEVSPRFLKHLETNSAHRGGKARAQAKIGVADLPTYELGATFVYSDGNIDRVSEADNAVVKWTRSDGTVYTASRNFLLPWSNWATEQQRGTANVAGAANTLWPTVKGSEVAFSADVTVQLRDNPDSTARRVDRWRCRNEGSKEVTVRAGTFDALVFVCGRGADPASPELVQTWYYAKQIRHYVRFVESEPQQDLTRTVDLVAVRPETPNWPPIVRAALGRAIVHALEAPEKESKVDWTSSGVNTRVTIAAKTRFLAPSGRPCRRFEQVWSENAERRHYHAVACKTSAGTWKIPGVESDTADLLATSGEIS